MFFFVLCTKKSCDFFTFILRDYVRTYRNASLFSLFTYEEPPFIIYQLISEGRFNFNFFVINFFFHDFFHFFISLSLYYLIYHIYYVTFFFYFTMRLSMRINHELMALHSLVMLISSSLCEDKFKRFTLMYEKFF